MTLAWLTLAMAMPRPGGESVSLVAASTYGAAAADLDEDGWVDLIEATSAGPMVRWNESGTLGPRHWLDPSLGGTPYDERESVAAADMDGDGHVDVCAYPSAGPLRCIRGTGTRTPGPTEELAGVGTSFGVWQLVDIDGDGDTDILGNDATHMYLHISDGLGSYDPVEVLLYSVTDVESADIDGDGTLEIIAVDQQVVHALAFDGVAVTEIVAVPVGDRVWGRDVNAAVDEVVSVLDVDGDGDDDLVLGVDASAWMESAGGTLLPPAPRADILTDQALDTDGDGAPDIVDFLGHDMVLPHTNQAQTSLFVPNSNGMEGMGWILPIDVDGDGVDEFTVALPNGDRFLSDPMAGPTITWQTLSSGMNLERGLALADLDGDGLDDLVYGSTDGVRSRLSVGDGSFGLQELLPTDSVFATELVDTDDDGHRDLVTIERDLTTGISDLVLRPGSPAGFGSPVVVREDVPYSSSSWLLRPVDLDGDGDPELLWRDGPTLNMVEGSSLTPVLMHADYFSDVAALDVDLDGRRDLVFVDSFEAVHVAFGQAAGGFGVPVLAYQGSWHSTGRLEAADLDADGVPEIVISRQRYEYDGYDVALGLAWDAGSGAFVEVASVNGSADGFRSLLGVLEGRPVVAEGSQNVTALEADLTLGERILDSPDSGEPIQVMAKGDVDGDGIEDLALASDQELWILVGVGGPIDSDMETGTIDPGTGDTGTVDPDPDPTPADTSAGDTGSLQTSPGDGDDGEKGRCGCASTPTPTGWSLLSRRR